MKNNKNKKGKLFFYFFIFLFLGGILGLGYLNFKIFLRRQEALDNLATIKERVGALSKQNAHLDNRIQSGNLDEYIERMTRDDLNMRRDGETVIAIPLQQLKDLGSSSDETKRHFWETILGR